MTKEQIASAIESILLWSKEIDAPTLRQLCALCRQLRGNRNVDA
jgi:hypothetical protein